MDVNFCNICYPRRLLSTEPHPHTHRCDDPDHWRAAGLTPLEGFYPEMLNSPSRFRVRASRLSRMRLECVDHQPDFKSAMASALAQWKIRGTYQVAIDDRYYPKRVYRHWHRLPPEFSAWRCLP